MRAVLRSRNPALASPHHAAVWRQVFNVETGTLHAEFRRPDICGLAPHNAGFIATDGLGHVVQLDATTETQLSHKPRISWDNHLIPIS